MLNCVKRTYEVETCCCSYSDKHGDYGECVGPREVVKIRVEHPIAPPTLSAKHGHRQEETKGFQTIHQCADRKDLPLVSECEVERPTNKKHC